MSNETDSIDINEFDKPTLPSGLKVLTILSIIGCVLQVVGSGWQFYTAKTNFDKKDEVIAQLNSAEMPAMAKKMIGDPAIYAETITKNFENRLPILLLSLVAAGLCFYGVMQMRQLKKQGYLLYVIGELLPFLTLAFFVGTFALSGTAFFIGIAITILFVLLYTVNRKHLVY